MIFVTLGTHEQPMPRLTMELEALARDRPEWGPFLIQYGASTLPAGWAGFPLLSPEALGQHMRTADVVITHAGPATISQARALGKVPIVVPRQIRFHEHVDDHQLRYARRLAAAGEVLLVEDIGELQRRIQHYRKDVAALPQPEPHAHSEAVQRFAEIVAELEG